MQAVVILDFLSTCQLYQFSSKEALSPNTSKEALKYQNSLSSRGGAEWSNGGVRKRAYRQTVPLDRVRDPVDSRRVREESPNRARALPTPSMPVRSLAPLSPMPPMGPMPPPAEPSPVGSLVASTGNTSSTALVSTMQSTSEAESMAATSTEDTESGVVIGEQRENGALRGYRKGTSGSSDPALGNAGNADIADSMGMKGTADEWTVSSTLYQSDAASSDYDRLKAQLLRDLAVKIGASYFIPRIFFHTRMPHQHW